MESTTDVPVAETKEEPVVTPPPPQTNEQDQNKPATYMIRPNFLRKFKKQVVQECIQNIQVEILHEQEYTNEEVSEWVEKISNQVKEKLKTMGYDRYKFIVQCIVGEQRGEAVKMACRCFWDSDTDNYAHSVFMNSSLFCVTAAFGVYFY